MLLTRVEYLKPARQADARSFAIVDAAMNDLIRPVLYQAWHDVIAVETPPDGQHARWDLVGPVCESGDFLAHDRELTLGEGTLLAICSAGAYGFVQSSNYNSRSRAAEVLVDGARFQRRAQARNHRRPVECGTLLRSAVERRTSQRAFAIQGLIGRLSAMQIQFSKMHGLGNDFMVIDQISQDVHLSPELIARWADRHTGIGFDQLLCVEAPTDPESDFRYRIFNADGTEAEQCGNGARCFAKFVVDHQLSVKTELRLQTNTGTIVTQLREDGRRGS